MDRISLDLVNHLPGGFVRAKNERLVADALLAVWRARRLVAAIVVIALLAGAAVLAFMEKRYAAAAVVQLDFGRRDVGMGVEQAPVVSLEAASLIQSEVKIIQSRPLARQVAEQLGLADDPGYSAPITGIANHLAAVQAAAITALDRLRGEEEEPAPPEEAGPEDDAKARLDRATARVMQGLSVSTDQRTYLITITGASRDPVMATRIANAVAEAYVRHRAETNVAAADRTSKWLDAQTRDANQALHRTEAKVARFRARTGLLEASGGVGGTAGTQGVEQQQLRELTTQLGAATAARMAEERRYARIQELLKGGSLPSATDLQGSPLITVLLERESQARRELNSMMSRLGAGHPSVREAQAGLVDTRARIDAEVRRAVAGAGSDLAATRRTEQELKKRLEALQRTMVEGKGDEAELLNLLTQVQSARERVAILARGSAQALAARDLRGTIAAMVIPAEPDRTPASPKPLLVMLVALVGGLAGGVGAATLADRLDRGFRTSDEVRDRLDRRCLGMVPELPRRRRGAAAERDQAIFDEAVYGVGAGIGLFGAQQACRVVLVTSSVREEGKTTLCSALAKALAATGQRVMLVASPQARGRLDEAAPALPAPTHEVAPPPLAAEATATAQAKGGALVVIDRKHPFMMSAGVFRSGGFAALLQDARKHFDVILIEGAPVMMVADSLVLGRLADTVIHVARWSNTRRRLVEAALRRLQEQSIVVDGVVLTRVDLRRHAKLRFLDECFFYLRERRFYQRAADRSAPPSPSPSV